MSFFEELKAGTALKATETNDRSGPMLRAGLEQKDIDAYHKDVLDTYVEEWEPLLTAKGLTFRTQYMEIDQATAEFLVACYEKFEKPSNVPEAERFDSQDGSKNKFDDYFDGVMAVELARKFVAELQAKIDACMKEFGCDKVFVKGSSRSAKDAVCYTHQFKRDFKQRCATASTTAGLDPNRALIALLGAGKDAMASASALYFLRLFLRSERIYQDLTLALEQVEGGGEFTQGFAIREWVDIDIGMEFRAFVHNKQLNACCQYDYLVLVDELQDEVTRTQLSGRISAFWEAEVNPALATQDNKFASYVVDFAVDTTGKMWVIELNPFQESTDGAMFSWAREGDQLRRGPFVFRVQHKLQNGEVCLSRTWREVYREACNEANAKSETK